MWCFSVWIRSSFITRWKTCCLCLKSSNKNWIKLCPNRKRNAGNRVWYQNFWLIYHRIEVQNSFGSPTIGERFQKEFILNTQKTSENENANSEIWFNNIIQKRQGNAHCRYFKQKSWRWSDYLVWGRTVIRRSQQLVR